MTRHQRRAARIGLEPLEAREVPAAFTVTTTAASGPGSLDDAITQANAAPDADTITFAVTGTILARYAFGPGYPSPSATGFDITHDLTIQGPGAGLLTVQGDPAYWPGPLGFWVESGVRATISGLTVQGMKPGASAVGAITNFGNLTLDRVVVSNSQRFSLLNWPSAFRRVVENRGHAARGSNTRPDLRRRVPLRHPDAGPGRSGSPA